MPRVTFLHLLRRLEIQSDNSLQQTVANAEGIITYCNSGHKILVAFPLPALVFCVMLIFRQRYVAFFFTRREEIE